MKASQGIEIEKKYDVGDDAAVPALKDLPGVARVGTPHTAHLEAVYFDTDRHTLSSRRVTLRRRTGGLDAGWHLKLPPEAAAASEGEPQQRRELHAPLGRPDVVPDILLAHVQAYLRGAQLVPVVRLETVRTTHALYGEDGGHLADLADDQVAATRLHPPADEQPQRWREWELELVDGGPELFGPAGALLAAAGARPAAHASKLARALGSIPGERDEGEKESPAAPRTGKKATATSVVTAYVGEELGQIFAADAAVRLEEPEGVHDMRSATRRIRSVLAAYRKLYRAVPVRRLRDELHWLGRLLGEPRDAEVLLNHLRAHIAELPPGEGADAVRAQVELTAGAAFDAGYRQLQEALQSERYFKLLDDLEGFCNRPPVLSRAAASGRTVAAKVVEKSARRLRRSHKAAAHARRGTAHENALHQARKDAKRLRHVAESAALVRGKRAGKVAKAAHRQQKMLGDYHDAVIARNLLQALQTGQELSGTTAEALAALGTRQAELMDSAEAKYRKARKKSRRLLKPRVI